MNMDNDASNVEDLGKLNFDKMMMLVRGVDPLVMISLMFLAYNTAYGPEYDLMDFVNPSGGQIGSGSAIDITSPVVTFGDGSKYSFPVDGKFYKKP